MGGFEQNVVSNDKEEEVNVNRQKHDDSWMQAYILWSCCWKNAVRNSSPPPASYTFKVLIPSP